MAVLAAITAAAGEQLNVLSGVRLGRVAQAAHAGDAELVLERTLGMDPTGVVVVDNVTYHYGALRDGALGQLTVDTPQGTLSGVQYGHRLNSVVVDATRSYSQLDLVRRALFVTTAEGPDLSILGRMLGVLRRPELTGDDQYRQLIRAIAYNPRTTVFGLTQALDVLVGKGNYVIIEDLENEPCTVIVALKNSGFLTAITWGRAYLSGTTASPLRNGAFAVPAPAFGIGAVHLQAAAFSADFTKNKPSAATAGPSGSLAAAPFVYQGSDESAVSAKAVGLDRQGWLLGGSGYYHADGGLFASTRVTADMRLQLPAVAKLSQDGRRCALRLVTEAGVVGLGCAAQGAQVAVGLCDVRPDAGSGAFVAGAAALLSAGTVHDLAVTLTARGAVQLWCDGVLVQSATSGTALLSNSASLPLGVDFGALSGTSGGMVALGAGLTAKPLRDFAAVNAAATAQTSNTLSLSAGVLPGDVGSYLTVVKGGGAAATGNRARGVFPVKTVSGQQVTLGAQRLGPVNVLGTTLTSTALHPPLRFPDDLGRTITLSGSTSDNNRNVVIASLTADDGTVLSDPTVPREARCRVATLTAAVANAESHLQAAGQPNLGPGATAQVVLNGPQRTVSQGTVSIAARSASPFAQAQFDVAYNPLLSAQVFEDTSSVNRRLTDGPPPTYAIWPLYLTDNQHFVQTYLDDMLVAGVKLKVVSAEEYT